MRSAEAAPLLTSSARAGHRGARFSGSPPPPPPPPSGVQPPLRSFLLLLNAALQAGPFPLALLPSSFLFFHPSSHRSVSSRVTPVPLTPPRSTQSTAFISFLLPFRAYFASLERRCAFYALRAPDPSSEPNREGHSGVGGSFPDSDPRESVGNNPERGVWIEVSSPWRSDPPTYTNTHPQPPRSPPNPLRLEAPK